MVATSGESGVAVSHIVIEVAGGGGWQGFTRTTGRACIGVAGGGVVHSRYTVHTRSYVLEVVCGGSWLVLDSVHSSHTPDWKDGPALGG